MAGARPPGHVHDVDVNDTFDALSIRRSSHCSTGGVWLRGTSSTR
jgi:hypothetical protein